MIDSLQATDGIQVKTIYPTDGSYDKYLQELLDHQQPYANGDALLIAIDNNMQIAFYETDGDGRYQLAESHRVELFGVGYLAGLCASLLDKNSLLLQCGHVSDDIRRFNDGFKVGFARMKTTMRCDTMTWHPEQYSDNFYTDNTYFYGQIKENYPIVIAHGCGILNRAIYDNPNIEENTIPNVFGASSFWDYIPSADFSFDCRLRTLVAEYLETWSRYKERKAVPEAVLGLASGYIDITGMGLRMLQDLTELHHDEAASLENQFLNSYIEVK